MLSISHEDELFAMLSYVALLAHIRTVPIMGSV